MKMWSRVSLLLLVFIATIALEVQLTDANVLFRFSLAFRANSDTSAENDNDEVFNKTITFDNNHLSIKNNLDPTDVIEEDVVTESPNDSQLSPRTNTVDELAWKQKFFIKERRPLDAADIKLKESFAALTKLQQEILNIEGRSEFLQKKLDKITICVNGLSRYVKEPTSSYVVDNLAKYDVLVDELKEPKYGVNNMEHTIDYNLLELALEKYEIFKLQDDVIKQLEALSPQWQQYNKTKVVQVDV